MLLQGAIIYKAITVGRCNLLHCYVTLCHYVF